MRCAQKLRDSMRTELTSDGKWVSIKGFMSAPDSDAVEQFKQGSLHWKVPATHPVALQYLPDSISKLLVSPVPTWTAEKPRGIHEDLWDKLFPYQKETVSAVVHKYRGRCLLAHEMGLGKSHGKKTGVSVLLRWLSLASVCGQF